MTLELQHLVAQARALASDHPCTTQGHAWQSEGGRACPRFGTDLECDNRSQAVYVCRRCGQYDYGEPGGPGHADCEGGCK